MSTDHRMMLWCNSWALVSGEVMCTGCLRSQVLSQSRKPFEHEAGCTNAETAGVAPWETLHNVLDSERG
jgi:hypothetical protein